MTRAIDAVMNAKAEATGEGLKALLREGLASTPVTIVPTKLAVQIADGAIKIQRLEFETGDARGSLDTTVELATLKFDSEWRLETKVAPPRAASGSAKPSQERPGIVNTQVGQLANRASVEPRFSTDGLERVLSLMRMEREVEELERLRREDEERVKKEQERQRALDEERRKASDADRTVAVTPAPVPQPQVMVAPAAVPINGPRPAAGSAPDVTTGSTPQPQSSQGGGAGGPGPGQAADAQSAQQGGQNALDFPKRPARGARPTAQPQQPKFSPFGAPGLGAN